MTKEEQIAESLEFCKDIYIYLEEKEDIDNEEKQLKEENDINKSHYETAAVLEKQEERELFANRMEKRSVSRLYIFFLCLVIAIAGANVISLYLIQITVVHGDSMKSTFENGDLVLIDKIKYRKTKPSRYDIVIFSKDSQVNLIKRVIGLPGEVVEVKSGEIFINGEYLSEGYGFEPMDSEIADIKEKLGPQEYFVMGDNRNNSLDSRYQSIGAVYKSEIIGKACLRFYPFIKWETY